MASLRQIDLILLVILDALLRERHLTRAASRIGLSQPAMSSALARLRAVFKDQLLVRTSSGMQPTPRGEALIEPIRQTLGQIERLLEIEHRFDPAISVRRFAVRRSGSLAHRLMPFLCGSADPGRPAGTVTTIAQPDKQASKVS